MMRDADGHEMKKGDCVWLLHPISLRGAFIETGTEYIFGGEEDYQGRILAHLVLVSTEPGFLIANTSILLAKADISPRSAKPRCPRQSCLAALAIFQGDWYCNKCRRPLWEIKQGPLKSGDRR